MSSGKKKQYSVEKNEEGKNYQIPSVVCVCEWA